MDATLCACVCESRNVPTFERCFVQGLSSGVVFPAIRRHAAPDGLGAASFMLVPQRM